VKLKRECPTCGYQSQFRVPCPVCQEARRKEPKAGRPKQSLELRKALNAAWMRSQYVHKRGPRAKA
jgi:uncharacterized Zn finger protein (UPF0148 family)